MKILMRNIVCIILFIGSSVMAQPELEISQSEFSFGMIPQNSTVSHKFWFKSIGDDTLKISEIKTGCSCAIMPLDQDYILPGDSMEVTFLWDVGKRVFRIGRYPYIFTNASEEPYRMSLTGEVHQNFDKLKPVSVSPFRCEMSKLRQTSIDEMEFTLINQTEQEYHITLLTSSVDECIIELPQVIPASGTAVGKMKIKKEFLDNEFKGSITIMIDDKNNTRISIPYRRKIY